MASAIAAARQQINDVGADGDLDAATSPADIHLDLDAVADPVELPDGKVIYPPRLHGRADRQDRLRAAGHAAAEPVALPAAGRPARNGQEPDRPRDADRLWTRRGRRSKAATASRSRLCRVVGRPRTQDAFAFKSEYLPDAEYRGFTPRTAPPRRVVDGAARWWGAKAGTLCHGRATTRSSLKRARRSVGWRPWWPRRPTPS